MPPETNRVVSPSRSADNTRLAGGDDRTLEHIRRGIVHGRRVRVTVAVEHDGASTDALCLVLANHQVLVSGPRPANGSTAVRHR